MSKLESKKESNLTNLAGSQDVAQEKKLLDDYGITHILNLAYGVKNAFEDDYNYKSIDILDVPETDIRNYFDECFEFIDEGRHYGNCLVHCNAGVSRSTAICVAYLMSKEKMRFSDALATVRIYFIFLRPYYIMYYMALKKVTKSDFVNFYGLLYLLFRAQSLTSTIYDGIEVFLPFISLVSFPLFLSSLISLIFHSNLPDYFFSKHCATMY